MYKVKLDTVIGDDEASDLLFSNDIGLRGISMKIVNLSGPGGGWPIVEYTSESKEALEKMIDEHFGGVDLKDQINTA